MVRNNYQWEYSLNIAKISMILNYCGFDPPDFCGVLKELRCILPFRLYN